MGRPKGAVSLISVRFGDLKQFISDDMIIPVGKVFLDSIGITDKLSSTVTNTQKPADEQSSPEITRISYDLSE